jgi:photosynthetic reaction center H subunit
MVGVNFFGNFDLASLSIWLFWLFFAGLIYYLQTENMREGYPLQDEEGNPSSGPGIFPVPKDKTFLLPNGQGTLTVPSGQRPDRTGVALARTSGDDGFPHAPTGNPLADGVGPASWANRKDVPELDAHGHAKITPMAGHPDFFVSAGRDPRGLPVLAKDDQVVAHITDMWVDASEHMVRYLEFELEPEHGQGKRLVPIGMVRVKDKWVEISSLRSGHFDGVPRIASDRQVTKLEEDKVSAYYAGGNLYS